MSTPVRLGYGLGPLIQLCEEHGTDVDALLDAAEIPRIALEEPTFRIRLEQETKFTRLALDQLNLPGAGLHVGQLYNLSMFGVLGLAAASAPSLLEMQRTLLAYPVLAWGMFEMSVRRRADDFVFVLEQSVDLGDCTAFFAERDMVAGLTIFRHALGRSEGPAQVSFRHESTGDVAAYRRFFECEVLFEQPANELRFGAAALSVRPLQANEMSFRFFDRQCRRISEMLMEPFEYADIVRSRMRSQTPMPDLPELAASLYMTGRTLQRRLAVEATSFSELLRTVRYERACELLSRGESLMDDIAYRLGFQDAVAFSRAFKHWSGLSPAAYREGNRGS